MAFLHVPETQPPLADYAAVSHLAAAVEALRADAQRLVPALRGRTVWMVNSTAAGGGVAELLPAQISLLRELELEVKWAVIETDQPEFFALTKRLHNLVHGVPESHPSERDRALYDAVSRQNADALRQLVAPDDVLVVHDPQPLGAGSILAADGVRAIWRSHIGIEEESEHTRAAWQFLKPYIEEYDQTVFSAAEYVPGFLRGQSAIIHPTIDPLSHKNRELSLHKLVGILGDAGLTTPHWPLLDPPFEEGARRLQPDGRFASATSPEDLGLLARPILTQVSRWDELKGFAPLLDAFVVLKQKRSEWTARDARHERRIGAVRLVLAGPDPTGIQDDPKEQSVLTALSQKYLALDPELQRDVALITLPMQSRKQNALMVNVLQRSADIVVQNSLREGFGLTVAEAMWKRTPVLGSGRACGVRLQVRDGVDGRLGDPEDVHALAALLHDMLGDSDRLEKWGRNAQQRVHEKFLLFTELQQWLRLLAVKKEELAREVR